VHIHNATIEYSSQIELVIAGQVCNTIRFSSVHFLVSSSAEKHLSRSDTDCTLFAALGPNSTLALEDCVLETTFDSPYLHNLVVCMAAKGGQVGDTSEPGTPMPLLCALDTRAHANLPHKLRYARHAQNRLQHRTRIASSCTLHSLTGDNDQVQVLGLLQTCSCCVPWWPRSCGQLCRGCGYSRQLWGCQEAQCNGKQCVLPG
jgi:hypothetical protein